jgi:hypothetical protein
VSIFDGFFRKQKKESAEDKAQDNSKRSVEAAEEYEAPKFEVSPVPMTAELKSRKRSEALRKEYHITTEKDGSVL